MKINNIIAKYSRLAIAASAVLPLACKVENETDDPNITFRTLDSTVSPTVLDVNVFKYIDIDNNGTIDAKIYAWQSNIYTDKFRGTILGEFDTSGFDVLTNPSGVASLKTLKTFNKGELIDSLQTTWQYYGYASMKKTTDSIGFDGQGDKLVGFRFMNGANKHYGWAKISVTNDGKNLTLKELAFDIRPNTPIKAGAK